MTALLEPTPRGLARLLRSKTAESRPALRDPRSRAPQPSIAVDDIGVPGRLAVRGALDARSIPVLMDRLNDLRWSDSDGRFIIDVRAVTRIDEDAVAWLATAWRAISTKNGHLSIICQSGPVAKVLANTELHDALELQPAVVELGETGPARADTRFEAAPSVSLFRRLARVSSPAAGPAA
jgi:anti-anti-sigma factor